MSILFYKKQVIFLKKFLALIFALIFLFSGCENQSNINTETIKSENENIIGVWINYNEIHAIIEDCETQSQLNEKIKFMLNEYNKYNINTIFIHSRAFDDSFYSSKIYQPSEYCSNDNSQLKFDVLQSFIDLSNEFNIEIHAWVNPYRIRKDNKVELINKNTLASEWYTQNPEDQRLIITENSIFYNPASMEVQKYVLSGVKEILENYNVDGVHIDDYFYPTTNENIDTEFYNEYVKQGGKLSLADYRRQNVNSLVTSIYSLVKTYNKDLCFSISPSADIDADYNSHYADVFLWASKKGYVDYIIPQIYFGFEHETMPFENVINEWINLKSDNTKIAIGLSVYKSGEVDIFAKSGSNEWIENADILKRQIQIINNNENLNGYSYYSSLYLINDYNENLKQEKQNLLS